MSSIHLSYNQFKAIFGDLGVRPWVIFNWVDGGDSKKVGDLTLMKPKIDTEVFLIYWDGYTDGTSWGSVAKGDDTNTRMFAVIANGLRVYEADGETAAFDATEAGIYALKNPGTIKRFIQESAIPKFNAHISVIRAKLPQVNDAPSALYCTDNIDSNAISGDHFGITFRWQTLNLPIILSNKNLYASGTIFLGGGMIDGELPYNAKLQSGVLARTWKELAPNTGLIKHKINEFTIRSISYTSVANKILVVY